MAETRMDENTRLLAWMEELLAAPYWIIDMLPEQVPADAGGRYFAVDRYYREPERLRVLREKFADIILKLYCYYDIQVSLDGCETWERNPEPEELATGIRDLPANRFVRVLFPTEEAMLDLDGGDPYMTLYAPSVPLLEKAKKLAEAAGLFVSAR